MADTPYLGRFKGRNCYCSGTFTAHKPTLLVDHTIDGIWSNVGRAIVLSEQILVWTYIERRDPESGKYRRTRLFVLTLGNSRKSVRLLTFKSSSKIWAQLHETAFRRLGGAPKLVVIDNLKEGVLKPDIIDPKINPLFRDLLAHYSCTALPARVRDPNRKGKVESAVRGGQDKLRGLRFESIKEAQAYLDRWEANWADTRIHGTTKRQVAAMFAEEKPFLAPLPIESFTFYEYGKRKVHLDGCVEVARAFYGAPPGWIGRELHVQWDEKFVRLVDPMTWELLREHLEIWLDLSRRGDSAVDARFGSTQWTSPKSLWPA